MLLVVIANSVLFVSFRLGALLFSSESFLQVKPRSLSKLLECPVEEVSEAGGPVQQWVTTLSSSGKYLVAT